MSNTVTPPMSAAELRRRVRAVEALKAKTREMAVATVLSTREAATKAAQARDEADLAAREAAAAALRLFDNDAELVAELLGVSAEELERDAKPVTAARAKEVIEELRARADRPRTRRTRTSRSDATATSTVPSAPSAVTSADDGRVDAA